ANEGDYTCVISTFAGTVTTTSAHVRILPAEPIRAQKPVAVDKKIRFRIQGGSALPFRLQWTKNLGDWTDVLLPSPVDGYIDFEAPTTEKDPGLFYRIIQ